MNLQKEISSILNTSYGQKGKIEVMAPMPSAITGDHGIVEKIYSFTSAKIKLINAFDDMLQDIKQITDYHLAQNDSHTFVDIAAENMI